MAWRKARREGFRSGTISALLELMLSHFVFRTKGDKSTLIRSQLGGPAPAPPPTPVRPLPNFTFPQVDCAMRQRSTQKIEDLLPVLVQLSTTLHFETKSHKSTLVQSQLGVPAPSPEIHFSASRSRDETMADTKIDDRRLLVQLNTFSKCSCHNVQTIALTELGHQVTALSCMPYFLASVLHRSTVEL